MATLAEVSRSRMLESVYDRFESLWQRGDEPDIEDFAAEFKDDSRRHQVLHELVLIDLEYRWRRAASAVRGKPDSTTQTVSPFAVQGRPLLEDYIERWPEFGSHSRLPIAAIVHEFRVRCDAGDIPELAEYFRRFPVQSNDLHDALQLEVEDRLQAARAIEGTQPPGTASTGKSDGFLEEQRHRTAKLTPGDSLGRYRILWPVGHGAMGTVYLAYDPDLDRQIAIKVPFLDGPHAARLTQRFRREAKLTASLRHPQICRVLDVDRQDGLDFLTMDYVDGTSLEALIKSGPLLPPAQAAAIAGKIAAALQAAHAAGVIHRDVKPSNILIDRRGEPVLTDFGLARRPEPDEFEQTRPGEWFGTPAYMAPEQFSGNSDDLRPSCDIFSLGVVLYRLLTGQRPFGDGHRHDDVASRTPPPHPHLLRAGLAPALSEICLRALRFDPRERFATAGEFAAALEPFANELPKESTGQVATTGPTVVRPRFPLRSLSRSAATILIVLAAISGGFAAWTMLHDNTQPLAINRARARTSLTTKDPALRCLPRVELHVQRAQQTEGYQVLGPEVGSLRDGDKMQFHVLLDEPAFVALFYVDADGNVSLCWPPSGSVHITPDIEVWDPTLAAAGDLQDMYLLGQKSGVELILAVASPKAFDVAALLAFERLRLNPIKTSAGFSFVARRDTPAGDRPDRAGATAAVRLTTLPLGSDPRLFGLAATDRTRAISGRIATQKSEWLDWEQFAERLAQLGEFCHGSAFHHAP